MDLHQRIDDDLRRAAAAKDARRLAALRSLSSAVKYREIELAAQLDETQVKTVTEELIHARKGAAERLRAEGGEAAAEAQDAEAKVLEDYLGAPAKTGS